MPNPIGITFMPSADAAANGPRQAGIEGQGGSDLAEAFKILSLHLPRVLGASAIAPKRLLTSQGSAAVAGPAGSNPYAAVFEALLHSLGAGSMGGGMNDPSGSGYAPQSLSSLFGGGTSGAGPYGGGSAATSGNGYAGMGDGGGAGDTSRPPAPNVSFDVPIPDVYGGPAPSSGAAFSAGGAYGDGGSPSYTTENTREDTQYI